jgi:phosphoserine phosphatase/DNA-binding HxlR family transcriptional regulator
MREALQSSGEAEGAAYDHLRDGRTYMSIQGLLLLKLFAGNTTFSRLVRETGLPRQTVAMWLQKFREASMLEKSDDPRHKQRVFYSLSPSVRKEVESFTRMNLVDAVNSLRHERKTRSVGGLPYLAVLFDLDGVVFKKPDIESADEKVSVSTWDVLFRDLGIYSEHERLKELYKRKQFKTYKDWTDAACKVLQDHGLDELRFTNVLLKREFTKGAKRTFEVLNNNGIETGVVTGSFAQLARRAVEKLQIGRTLAHCDLHFDETGKLVSWTNEYSDYDDKIALVEWFERTCGIDPTRIAYVGDDVNDIPVFRKVGLPIAFNATKKSVEDAAKVVVHGDDLSEILKLLGLELPIDQSVSPPLPRPMTS